MYNQSYTNPHFGKSVSYLYNIYWDSYEDFKRIYIGGDDADPEFIDAYHYMGSFFEGVGVLVREGFLDIRLVALLMTGNIRNFWDKTAPIINEFRTASNWPRLLIETEYLYNELMKYHKQNPDLELNLRFNV
jgi:hypothetical protein